MIGLLEGRVLNRAEDFILLGVGVKGSQVGYQILVPRAPSYLQIQIEDSVCFFIHTHVREDVLDLFGFLSSAEKEVFLALVSVNGIGPKVGLNVLSRVSPPQLIRAILDRDKTFLTTVPGIGKKTAERVVLELFDRVEKRVASGAWAKWMSASEPTGASVGDPKSLSDGGKIQDVKAALLALGFKDQQIGLALDQVFNEDSSQLKVEELIKKALQELS